MPQNDSIELRRGTTAGWANANPVLDDGEPGFERSTGRVKIGDGATAWNDLPYVGDGDRLGLTAVALITADYSAGAGEFVPCSTSIASLTVTLPDAPADGAVVGAKHVTQGATNTVTVVCDGTDTFNRGGGPTTMSLPLLAQAAIFQYRAANGVWYVVSNDFSLTSLDLRFAPKADPTFSGHVTVPTPTTSTDAVTKAYADALASGFKVKSPPAACATTANIALTGEQTIDGHLTSTDRVLVKDQTLPAENGIWRTAAGAWTRTTDCDASAEFTQAYISVTAGPVNGGSSWVQQTVNPVVGTDPIVWGLFQSAAGLEHTSNKDVAGGYPSLDGTTKVPIAEIPTGTTGATVPFGNDARFSNARAPLAHKATHQDGGDDELAIDASQVTSGTFDDARIPSGITRDTELDAHVNDTTAAHAASAIAFTPNGSIAATDVQAAIQEVRDEAGGGGAPTTADYLVGTSQGGLSAEIVVGPTPGGELGGSWAAPTVDATHSGSSHASVQSAAEATAATALSGHVAAADPHPGYLTPAEGNAAYDAIGAAAAAQAASQPVDSDLTAIAALTTTSFGRSLLVAANAAALGITASDVGAQPVDSDLTAIAALTTTSFGRAFLALADAAAVIATLGLDLRYAAFQSVNRIGSFIFAGHSWLVYGGSGGDEQGRRAEGVAGRFASMENISTTEVISLGRSGAQLSDDSTFPRIGWSGLNQLLVPGSNLRKGINGNTPAAPYAAQPGGLFLLYGINETLTDPTGFTTGRGVYRAFPHALRSAISARRAGGTFDESHASIVFSGFATTVTTAKASGVGYKKTVANGDTFTITIPADFPGGVIPVQLIGTPDVNTAVPVGLTINASQTKIAASAFGYLSIPVSGSTLITIDSEQMLLTAINGTGTQSRQVTDAVTNGTTTITSATAAFTAADVGKLVYGPTSIPAGTTIASVTNGTTAVMSAAATGSQSAQTLNIYISYTVTRGANGTTAASHTAGTGIFGTAGANVTWSGTCSNGAGSTLTATPPAATPVAAQGIATNIAGVAVSTGTIPIVKRFTGLTAADAGKTIIGTVAGVVAGTEQFVGFDCYRIQAPVTAPIVVCNAARYAYAFAWAFNTAAIVNTMNTLMASVVAEFDSTVTIADVDATFTAYGGILAASMDATTNPLTVAITPGTKGPNAGEFVRIDTEECFIRSISGSNYTLDRAQNGTTIAAHSSGAVAYNRSLYSFDNVHPSTLGQRVLAGLLKSTFGAMSLTATQLDEANGYYRVEQWTLRNLSYVVARGERGLLLTTDQKMTSIDVATHRPVVVSAIGCEVVTAGSAGSIVRLGIYGDNGDGLPSQLIVDAGTIDATTTGWKEITNFRQFLNPGVYHLVAAPQGAPATAPTLRSHISLSEDLRNTGVGNPAGDYFGSGILRNSGVGTIPNAIKPQSVTIAHGLSVTPAASDFTINFDEIGPGFTSANTVSDGWVTNVTSTNFTVNANYLSSTATRAFHWNVDARRSTTEFAKTGWTQTGVSAALPGAASQTPTAGEGVMVGMRVETVEPV